MARQRSKYYQRRNSCRANHWRGCGLLPSESSCKIFGHLSRTRAILLRFAHRAQYLFPDELRDEGVEVRSVQADGADQSFFVDEHGKRDPDHAV